MRINLSGQPGLLHLQIKEHRLITGSSVCPRLRISADPSSFRGKAIHINFRDSRVIGKTPGFRQNRPVLRNDILTSEHKVCRRLINPGRRIEISTHQAGRVLADQRTAVRVLAYHLVTGRKIYHYHSACRRMRNTRRTGYPEILADLGRHNQVPDLSAGKKQIHAEGNLLAVPVNPDHRLVPRCKVPALVKLIVIGNVFFGDKPKQLPSVQHSRRIVQLAFYLQRQADKNQRVSIRRLLPQVFQLHSRLIQQTLLQEQVAAGISRQTEFRK